MVAMMRVEVLLSIDEEERRPTAYEDLPRGGAAGQEAPEDRGQVEGNSLLIMADGTAISGKKEIEAVNGTAEEVEGSNDGAFDGSMRT
jgi:hypothetical protein